MKRIGSREFKNTFNHLSEEDGPFEVMNWKKTIGWYYPGPNRPDSISALTQTIKEAQVRAERARQAMETLGKITEVMGELPPEDDEGGATAPVASGPKPKQGGPGAALDAQMKEV